MASSDELVTAICEMIRLTPSPIPVSFKNHSVEQVAAIIGAVVGACAKQKITLSAVAIDPDLAEELGLVAGRKLPQGNKPEVQVEPGLGRQVRFVRK